MNKILWQGQWVSIIDCGVGYECLHEKDIILCLPVVQKKYVLIREEYCPPYFVKDKIQNRYYTVISGKIEENENWRNTLYREIEEEFGIKPIGSTNCMEILFENKPICKSTDMRGTYVIWYINHFIQVNAKGDGTLCEEKSKTNWINLNMSIKFLRNQRHIDMLLLYGLTELEKKI